MTRCIALNSRNFIPNFADLQMPYKAVKQAAYRLKDSAHI
jgi:hypothetical protein